MNELRHIYYDGKRSTIQMEKDFWSALEYVSKEDGNKWQYWVKKRIDANTKNKTGQLRIAIIKRMHEMARNRK